MPVDNAYISLSFSFQSSQKNRKEVESNFQFCLETLWRDPFENVLKGNCIRPDEYWDLQCKFEQRSVLTFIIMLAAIISWPPEDCKTIANLSAKVIKFLLVVTTSAQNKTVTALKEYVYREAALFNRLVTYWLILIRIKIKWLCLLAINQTSCQLKV